MSLPEDSSPISLPPPSTIPPPLVAPRGDKRVIAVGGGRGGVGLSLLTTNLAVYLAQLGRSVVVIDADPTGPKLHSLLGVSRPELASASDTDRTTLHALDTVVPGLRLLSARSTPTALRPLGARGERHRRSIHLLRQLAGDYAVVHLGAGTTSSGLDLFSSADLAICVTTPEPAAVESTYTFLRALFLRRLRRSLRTERFKLRMVERAVEEAGLFATPIEILHTLGRYDGHLATLAAEQLRCTRAHLVVNATRLRTDADLGAALEHTAERFLGLSLSYIGHIEQDDAVWLTVRHRRPLLIDSPTSKSARLIERIARRVVARTALPPSGPEPPTPMAHQRTWTFYDLLGLSRGASDEEVRRAYKKQKELFSPGSLALGPLLSDAQIQAEQTTLEEAHDTLLDAIRRKAYDVSTFADEAVEPPALPSLVPPPLTPEQEMLQAELAREIHGATEFSGPFLRRIRESQGLTLGDIATRTKIPLTYLQAIEDERFEQLPAVVYTRGFVREMAKILKLDPAQVDRSYLQRLRTGWASLGREIE